MDWFRSIWADFSVPVCAFFGRNFRVLCSVIIQHDYFKFALLFFYQYGQKERGYIDIESTTGTRSRKNREIWKKRRCDVDIGYASDDNNNQNNF
ncbi:hypothetical protein QE152_g33652 [Popillia japonica]|uniref:Uncharacterized protein n=1 Tax=Popillia japonica TaxID=7064 RepID=A0AAW1IW19_POPJA